MVVGLGLHTVSGWLVQLLMLTVAVTDVSQRTCWVGLKSSGWGGGWTPLVNAGQKSWDHPVPGKYSYHFSL